MLAVLIIHCFFPVIDLKWKRIVKNVGPIFLKPNVTSSYFFFSPKNSPKPQVSFLCLEWETKAADPYI